MAHHPRCRRIAPAYPCPGILAFPAVLAFPGILAVPGNSLPSAGVAMMTIAGTSSAIAARRCAASGVPPKQRLALHDRIAGNGDDWRHRPATAHGLEPCRKARKQLPCKRFAPMPLQPQQRRKVDILQPMRSVAGIIISFYNGTEPFPAGTAVAVTGHDSCRHPARLAIEGPARDT